MNSAQTNLYFYEWGLARKHYLAKGFDPKQADAKRHALHRKAFGCDKSSKDFTNADLDKVIAVFRAVWDGGNLDAQIEQIEQPQKRRGAALSRINVLKMYLRVKNGLEGSYVGGISRKLFGTDQYQNLDDVKIAQLEGVIVRRLLQIHSAERVEQIRADAAEQEAWVTSLVKKSEDNVPF